MKNTFLGQNRFGFLFTCTITVSRVISYEGNDLASSPCDNHRLFNSFIDMLISTINSMARFKLLFMIVTKAVI